MGFLNPVADDDYRIANMPGTSELPAPSAFEGALTAIPEGIASGAAKVADLGIDFSQTQAGQILQTPLPLGPAPLNFVLGEYGKQINAGVKVAADWGATGQDPRKTGVVGRIASGVSEGLTIGGAGAAVGGPWGAAALLGATEGHATYQDALAQKESPEAAKEQAILSGAFSAAGALLPMKFGSSAITSILGGAAANVGLGAAQRGLTSQVLADNGYPQMAAQQRVFDGESMAADLILGGAFGAMGHFLVRDPSRINPADVDAASAVATEDHFNHSAPGVPTDPSVANLHVQTMTDALNKLADGDLPDVQPDVAQKIVDGVIPDPTQEMAEPLHEAALEDLPGYDVAAAEIPRVELPAEEPAPVREEPPEPAAGEPAPTPDVPLDPYHAEMLDHLVHNYGDATYTTDDGREVTFKQMADELQQQRNEADSFGKLHEIAAACAARNGG